MGNYDDPWSGMGTAPVGDLTSSTINPNTQDILGQAGLFGAGNYQYNYKTGQFEWVNNPGSSGGGLPLMGSAPAATPATGATPGLVAPAATPAATGILGTGITYGDALKTILGLYSAYQSSKGGSFHQVPQSPEQVSWRNYLTNLLQHSPTEGMLGNLLSDYAKNSQSSTFKLPQGANGYQPYQGGQPDYSSLINAIANKNQAGTAPMASDGGPGSGGTPAPPPAPPPKPTFAPGGVTSAGGTAPTQQGQQALSEDDKNAFLGFIRRHGQSAGQFVLDTLGHAPGLGMRGAMAMYGGGDVNPMQVPGA